MRRFLKCAAILFAGNDPLEQKQTKYKLGRTQWKKLSYKIPSQYVVDQIMLYHKLLMRIFEY